MSADVMPPSAGPDPCLECDSRDVVHIIYGMLTPDGMDELQPWEILGGCVLRDDAPTRRCNRCGCEWALFGEGRRDDSGDGDDSATPRARRSTKFPKRLPRRPQLSGPRPRRPGPRRYSSPTGRLANLETLLSFAEVQDVEELGDWVSDRCELDAFALLHDGDLAVGFHTRAVRIDFPTTISEFWESVNEVEDETLAEIEAEYEAELTGDDIDN